MLPSSRGIGGTGRRSTASTSSSTAIEAKDYSHAYALWNSDPDWQQHLDRYKLYTFDQFKKDWGPSGDYGVITKAKIVVTKEYGSGVVIGVRVNDNPKILFLWVEKKSKTIGYSPVELRFLNFITSTTHVCFFHALEKH